MIKCSFNFYDYSVESTETKNELMKEVVGYENIVVLQDIKVVDADTIDILHQNFESLLFSF